MHWLVIYFFMYSLQRETRPHGAHQEGRRGAVARISQVSRKSLLLLLHRPTMPSRLCFVESRRKKKGLMESE